jgi:hypothetical protein
MRLPRDEPHISKVGPRPLGHAARFRVAALLVDRIAMMRVLRDPNVLLCATIGLPQMLETQMQVLGPRERRDEHQIHQRLYSLAASPIGATRNPFCCRSTIASSR